MKSNNSNENSGPLLPATSSDDFEAKMSQANKRKLGKKRREFFGSDTSNTLTADAIQEWSSRGSITKDGVEKSVVGQM